MSDFQVWVRLGDQDDYHTFDSPELAAEHVHEYLHTPDECECESDSDCDHMVTRFIGGALVGVEIDDLFTGYDSVSLFWGDGDAQLYAALSDLELDVFTNNLG